VHTLDTQEQSLFIHEIDWRSEFLSVITDPNVAYMLMLIGIYGMIFEFYSPGVGVPGVVGAVCLLVALYAFQVLPISYAGLALMLLGIGLMTAEALSPTFGILGLGGIVSFVIGSIILMDTELPGYQIALPMIFAFATFSAGILIFAIGMVVRARKQAVVSGLDHLLGAMAVVETVRAGSARVRLDGELWQVNCEDSLNEDDAVTITAINGITLDVTKENGGRGS
jgi:membrane-bound serine protease (ClpP class)